MSERYVRLHLEPLLPRLWEVRADMYGMDFEWAIPRVHAVEAHLTKDGNMFYGLPIVVDDNLDAPTIRMRYLPRRFDVLQD